ncbi:MAG TPA: branched-chain amino acid ABC transporter permease [Thermodesulfobacteriota bacterium]|nr:branched-chain amino acid ABC transporter permease [Thermodesulfobacteriota bacterium]
MNRLNWEKASLYVVLLAILALVPVFFRNMYQLGVITFMLINVLLAVSCWFIMTTGQVTLGHAGFAAIGGYVSAALIARYGIGSWLSLLIAMIAAGVIAFIIGYITLRIKGIYFIVATLALGEVIRVVFGAWDDPFGGLVGIMNLPPPKAITVTGFFAVDFGSKVSLYYLTLVLTLSGVIIMHRLNRSPIGLVFQGIRQADDLAESVGINLMGYKVLAFVIGCMFAALAGVLYTYSVGSIQPSSFTLIQSAYYLVYVAVGGSINVFGPILGALLLNILSEFLRPVKEFEPIVFALILIGAVLLLHGGIIGLVQTLWHRTNDMAVRVSKFVSPDRPLKTIL